MRFYPIYFRQSQVARGGCFQVLGLTKKTSSAGPRNSNKETSVSAQSHPWFPELIVSDFKRLHKPFELHFLILFITQSPQVPPSQKLHDPLTQDEVKNTRCGDEFFFEITLCFLTHNYTKSIHCLFDFSL